MQRYISVDIYRHGTYDCTAGGVTAAANCSPNTIFVVPCKDGNWTEEEVNTRPGFVVLEIEKRNFNGEYVNLRPADAGKAWTMFGGNFAWSSDSRFRQYVSERPLPVHDRIEG